MTVGRTLAVLARHVGAVVSPVGEDPRRRVAQAVVAVLPVGAGVRIKGNRHLRKILEQAQAEVGPAAALACVSRTRQAASVQRPDRAKATASVDFVSAPALVRVLKPGVGIVESSAAIEAERNRVGVRLDESAIEDTCVTVAETELEVGPVCGPDRRRRSARAARAAQKEGGRNGGPWAGASLVAELRGVAETRAWSAQTGQS